MTMLRRVTMTFVLGVLMSVMTASCGHGVQPHTMPVSGGALSSSADAATLVVFRRPGGGGAWVNGTANDLVTLFDSEGRVLGQLNPGEWTRFTVPVGTTRVYGIPGRNVRFATGIEIQALPGMVYYASIPRVGGMVAVTTRDAERWDARTWVGSTDAREVRFDDSQGDLMDEELRMETRMRVVEYVDRAFAEMDPARRMQFTLLPNDGEAR